MLQSRPIGRFVFKCAPSVIAQMREYFREAEREAEEEQAEKERKLKRELSNAQHRLGLIHLCRETALEKRQHQFATPSLSFYFGYVYLRQKYRRVPSEGSRYGVLKPAPCGPFKIGSTGDYRRRSRELMREQLWPLAKYPTVVYEETERELHAYFDEFRLKKEGELRKGERKNEAGELFRLPKAERVNFLHTVKLIEEQVFAREELRLKWDIKQIETKIEWAKDGMI